MKKLFLSLAVALSLVAPVGFVASAAAVDVAPICQSGKLATTDVCGDIEKNNHPQPNIFVSTIKSIINVLSYIVGVAAVIGAIVSGLRMILANGDSSGVASARNSLIYSMIGIAIVATAQALVAFVLNKL